MEGSTTSGNTTLTKSLWWIFRIWCFCPPEVQYSLSFALFGSLPTPESHYFTIFDFSSQHCFFYFFNSPDNILSIDDMSRDVPFRKKRGNKIQKQKVQKKNMTMFSVNIIYRAQKYNKQSLKYYWLIGNMCFSYF